MDPTVIAAAIGVGGTVIVGVVGFWSTKTASDEAAQAATGNTTRALDAARDERIWDRRARAYEQSIAALLYRRQRRRMEQAQLHGTPMLAYAQVGPPVLGNRLLFQENVSLPDQPYFDRYPPRGWFEVEGTLLAYATPKVIMALDAARHADDAARIAFDCCWELQPVEDIVRGASPRDPGAAPEALKPDANAEAELRAAQEALKCALEDAEQKDKDLINAIRDDLAAKPSQAPADSALAQAQARASGFSPLRWRTKSRHTSTASQSRTR